jgi:hypothetical protein
MKKNMLLTWSAVIVICLSGFAPNRAPVAKKKQRVSQMAWIWSNYEEAKGCPGQHYQARDLEPGDQINWYRWPQSNPEYPLEYMGSSVDLYFDLEEYDMIILEVIPASEEMYSTGEWIKPCSW